jgi:putative ATPase
VTDLWASKRKDAVRKVEPLAVRMRPRTLEEVAGQTHILGPGKLLRRMLDADALTSVIFYGPPGTGKTTLAEVIAGHTNRHFERENASSVGVARIRQVIEDAERRLHESGRRTVLFLDEIHRFSRSQQDVLLADVERGLITLIGATTENPMFAVNSALVSRSTVFRLEPLSEEDVVGVLRRAIADPECGYGKLNLVVDDDALRVWAVKSDGDARRALTALEVAVLSEPPAQAGGVGPSNAKGPPLARAARITKADAEDSIQQKMAVYDITGDEHYDAISAMIKSVRGSDPDAAVYWIARMLESGEDPRFIARRLAILASEDIGNADPRGIMVAASAWELVERVGMPEGRIILSQAAIYLALAPKSNASYVAIDEAMADVKGGRTVAVPIYLRDSHKPEAEGSPRDGRGYVYTHGIEDHPNPVSGQDYLGVDRQYYRPAGHGAEKQLAERLEDIRRRRAAARSDSGSEPPAQAGGH